MPLIKLRPLIYFGISFDVLIWFGKFSKQNKTNKKNQKSFLF